MSVGRYRVGVTFNPSGNPAVDEIKHLAAELIDRIERIDTTPRSADNLGYHVGEKHRLKALAQTAIEEGAMWAVKAATKPAPEEGTQ